MLDNNSLPTQSAIFSYIRSIVTAIVVMIFQFLILASPIESQEWSEIKDLLATNHAARPDFLNTTATGD